MDKLVSFRHFFIKLVFLKAFYVFSSLLHFEKNVIFGPAPIWPKKQQVCCRRSISTQKGKIRFCLWSDNWGWNIISVEEWLTSDLDFGDLESKTWPIPKNTDSFRNWKILKGCSSFFPSCIVSAFILIDWSPSYPHLPLLLDWSLNNLGNS